MKKDIKLIGIIRAMLSMEQDGGCPCTETSCEWHGLCYECVRIHRYYGDRLPMCLQALAQCPAKDAPKGAKGPAGARFQTPADYWKQIKKVATGKWKPATTTRPPPCDNTGAPSKRRKRAAKAAAKRKA